jgi:hypothetical protein
VEEFEIAQVELDLEESIVLQMVVWSAVASFLYFLLWLDQ